MKRARHFQSAGHVKDPTLLKKSITFPLLLFLLSPNILTPEPDYYTVRFTHINTVLTKFDKFVKQTIEEWNLPGAACAVVYHDSIMFKKGYGFRKIGHPEYIDAHTVFRIASVSKGFASALTGLLVQEGLLNWDDKVINYLPDFTLKDSLNTQNLTIRHILSHTSGLIPHAFDNLIEANVPFEKILPELSTVSIVAPVGQQYGYQNVVYSLIGEIIESVSNKKYGELIREQLFEPLEMKDASVGWEGLMAESNRASPHIRRRYRWTPTRDKKAYYTVSPSAGVNASISDMAQWLRAQMGGMDNIILPEILQTIHMPQIRTRGEMRRYYWNGHVQDTHYGLGWRIFNYEGHTMITHSGGVQGYLAQLAFIPELDMGIVVLYNSRRIDFLLPTFFDMVLGLDDIVDSY